MAGLQRVACVATRCANSTTPPDQQLALCRV